ncbi:MAG: uroporphyrinogen decarboxylase family protein [Candidatus Thorarchaeota archaeon]
MPKQKSEFFKALSKESTTQVPLYCTGYPDLEFIDNYIHHYKLKLDNRDIKLNQKNYNIIEQMGFNAISLWNFRRGEGGYSLDDQRKVDGWGRIYKGDWYMWDGVFKNEKIVDEWTFLTLPSEQLLKNLKFFLKKTTTKLEFVFSLPGLFEKTWQSMGFHYFAKNIKKNIGFIRKVVSYFSNYTKKLIKTLQNIGIPYFLIADDYGYRNRTFIPVNVWKDLFFKDYRNLINLIHSKNQKVILHSDGDISNMIENFINLGFDAIQSLEPNAGVDIFSLFEKFKDKICFIGNLDAGLLTFGTPKQVKTYTTELITIARKHKCSLVVSPSHRINSKCNPENINTMIQTAKIFK